eukprot:TRINITY_DN11017_c0_g2_i1.p1 TRINITY_DN11017_c0_g2~~TRINITY_DN11017_c0_g2_i1.p1  ORF type:complete len:353 (+),score=26.91 TRINITY_DN11017_c0_g2_i1:58-1059(+)
MIHVNGTHPDPARCQLTGMRFLPAAEDPWTKHVGSGCGAYLSHICEELSPAYGRIKRLVVVTFRRLIVVDPDTDEATRFTSTWHILKVSWKRGLSDEVLIVIPTETDLVLDFGVGSADEFCEALCRVREAQVNGGGATMMSVAAATGKQEWLGIETISGPSKKGVLSKSTSAGPGYPNRTLLQVLPRGSVKQIAVSSPLWDGSAAVPKYGSTPFPAWHRASGTEPPVPPKTWCYYEQGEIYKKRLISLETDLKGTWFVVASKKQLEEDTAEKIPLSRIEKVGEARPQSRSLSPLKIGLFIASDSARYVFVTSSTIERAIWLQWFENVLPDTRV